MCIKVRWAAPPTCDVLNDVTTTISLGGSACSPWVFANAGAHGLPNGVFARDARALAPDVLTVLTAPERLSLVEDEWRSCVRDATASPIT